MKKRIWWHAALVAVALFCFVLGGAAVAGAAPWKITSGSIAVKTDGSLWSLNNGSLWSWSGSGSVPARIGAANDWADVASDAGGNYGSAVAIKTDGSLWAWGDNDCGQLGDGTTKNRTSPVRIGTSNDWKSVSINGIGDSTFAIKTDGTLWAWGHNYYGNLGDGTTTDRYVPTRIGTATNWKSVSGGVEHTVAIKTDGSLWEWGNEFAQMDSSITTFWGRNAPARIGTDNDWKSVAAGWYHTAALKTNGSLWVWGWNGWGQLGDGTTTSRTAPTRVGATSDWMSVASDVQDTYTLKSDGTLWSWSSYTSPQLFGGASTNCVSISSDAVIKADGSLWVYGCYTGTAIPLTRVPDYTVTFTNGTSKTIRSVISGAKTTAPAVSKSGYSLLGWYTVNASTGGAKFDATKGVTADVTYYARWAPIYTVTFINGSSKTVRSVVSGAKTTAPAVKKTGYALAGWYTVNTKTGGTKFDATKAVTKSVTYYARWKSTDTTLKALKVTVKNSKASASASASKTQLSNHAFSIKTANSTSAAVAATKTNGYATVQIYNGKSWVAASSKTTSLAKGKTYKIYIRVISESGAVGKTYTVTITRTK